MNLRRHPLNRRNAPRRGVGGFSLVELLLTLVLILCLAAASVFSYTALHRTANLDEGVNRLESLLRFTRAEAATTGRKLQLQFPAAASMETSAEVGGLREIKVMWEPDFLHSPGVFLEYTNKSWTEEIVNEVVGVANVRTTETDRSPVGLIESADEAVSVAEANSETETLESNDFPSITFYPDGSCDSAEILLASRNGEDERMLEVKLSGILGSVTSRLVSKAGPDARATGSPENETAAPEWSSTQGDADEFPF